MLKNTKQKLNKSDIIKIFASKLEITKKEAEQILDDFLEIIVTNVANNVEVNLTGFGLFYQLERQARTGVDPINKQKIQIPKCYSVGFRMGKNFRDKLNNKTK